MLLANVFETLLSDRQIALYLVSYRNAESLRVSLLRKFKDYKEQMTALGFLPENLEDAVVSLEWNSEAGVARFFLRKRNRKMIEYRIVTSEKLEEPR